MWAYCALAGFLLLIDRFRLWHQTVCKVLLDK